MLHAYLPVFMSIIFNQNIIGQEYVELANLINNFYDIGHHSSSTKAYTVLYYFEASCGVIVN